MVGCSGGEKETPAESSDEPIEEVAAVQNNEGGVDSLTRDSISATPAVTRALARLETVMIVDGKDTTFQIVLKTKTLTEVVDTVSAFKPIGKDDYSKFDVPENALNAGGDWYEEAGEYFYVVEEGKDLVVYHAWLKEEQTTNTYPYKEIRRFKLPSVDL